MKTPLLLLLLAFVPILRADDALFFGNSFTEANHLTKLVEDVAASKGKSLATGAHTRSGMGWSYHLSGTGINTLLAGKPWRWVIIQDQSLGATHTAGGKPGGFMKSGEEFYNRIGQFAPQATLVLFETWAYESKNPIYKSVTSSGAETKNLHARETESGDENSKATKTSKMPPGEFSNPDEMIGEIQKSYRALEVALQAKDTKRHVILAPIGEAFAKCLHEHPEINLYSKDSKHPGLPGSYLAACVLYAVMYNDSPIGAAPTPTVDPTTTKVVQEIAAAVALKK